MCDHQLTRHQADREVSSKDAERLRPNFILRSTTMTVHEDDLPRVLQELEVPADFNVYETTDDNDVVVRLEKWRQRAYTVLADLRRRLQDREVLTSREKVEVVSAVAQFHGEGSWIADGTHIIAKGVS